MEIEINAKLVVDDNIFIPYILSDYMEALAEGELSNLKTFKSTIEKYFEDDFNVKIPDETVSYIAKLAKDYCCTKLFDF